MVHCAGSRNLKLTIEMTGDGVSFVLANQTRIDAVKAWQLREHEIDAQPFTPTCSDGYSNDLSPTLGKNGAVYMVSAEAFLNQLRVI